MIQNGRSQTTQEELDTLRNELYEKNEDVDGVPIGIRLLWDLVLKCRSNLFGPNIQEIIRSGGKKVGELLGTGSIGLVFSLEEEADAVLKCLFYRIPSISTRNSKS
jgi:hypothetical protein